MRIVAGALKGRRLSSPKDNRIRPTSDRLRESLFNRLAHRDDFDIAGARVADLFAGTGALGLEALSRGAAEAVFVEQSRAAIRLIRDNIAALGLEDRARVLAVDARKLPAAASPFNLVFLDPPYGKGLLPPALAALRSQGWLQPHSLIGAEIGAEEALSFPADFTIDTEFHAGRSRILLMRVLN